MKLLDTYGTRAALADPVISGYSAPRIHTSTQVHCRAGGGGNIHDEKFSHGFGVRVQGSTRLRYRV